MFFLNKRSNFEKKLHELSYRSNIILFQSHHTEISHHTPSFDKYWIGNKVILFFFFHDFQTKFIITNNKH